jgi:hypothetical protein
MAKKGKCPSASKSTSNENQSEGRSYIALDNSTDSGNTTPVRKPSKNQEQNGELFQQASPTRMVNTSPPSPTRKQKMNTSPKRTTKKMNPTRRPTKGKGSDGLPDLIITSPTRRPRRGSGRKVISISPEIITPGKRRGFHYTAVSNYICISSIQMSAGVTGMVLLGIEVPSTISVHCQRLWSGLAT